MSEAIARAAVAAGRWRIAGAGLNATPGAPMPLQATALSNLGISVDGHRARQLTPGLIAEAHTIYCMTAAHRDAVLAIAPDAAAKTICLDPDGDVPEPHGQPQPAYDQLANRLHDVITQRLAEAAPAGAGQAG